MLIDSSRIDQAMTYDEYRDLLDRLIKINQTTGTNQSEEMINYAKMNLQRMQRIEKTAIEPALQQKMAQIKGKYTFLILTEGWCGDAAQILPVLGKLATFNENIQLLVLLRDENLDIMDAYLTNGGRAIPKIILLETETLKEITNWGPRPKAAQNLVWDLKNEGKSHEEINLQLHTWYAKDKTKAIQAEFIELLEFCQ
jgi:thiol-disulfide isomerase/thioredoxin